MCCCSEWFAKCERLHWSKEVVVDMTTKTTIMMTTKKTIMKPTTFYIIPYLDLSALISYFLQLKNILNDVKTDKSAVIAGQEELKTDISVVTAGQVELMTDITN
jgi:hypothetical protein